MPPRAPDDACSERRTAIDETLLLLRSLGSLLARAHRAAPTQAGLAALIANLAAHVEQLAALARELPTRADNDQGPRIGRCTLYESLSAGPDRTLYVARCGTRWYVLEGFTIAAIASYAPEGPFETRCDAYAYALQQHGRAIHHSRIRIHEVPPEEGQEHGQ